MSCLIFNPSVPFLRDLFPESCRRHDSCYGHEGRMCRPREHCDTEFFQNMLREQMPYSRNPSLPLVYYFGVRIGGGDYYGKP